MPAAAALSSSSVNDISPIAKNRLSSFLSLETRERNNEEVLEGEKR